MAGDAECLLEERKHGELGCAGERLRRDVRLVAGHRCCPWGGAAPATHARGSGLLTAGEVSALLGVRSLATCCR